MVIATRNDHGKTAMIVVEETLVMIGAANVDVMKKIGTVATGIAGGDQITIDSERGITRDGNIAIGEDTHQTAIGNVGGMILADGGTIEVGRGSGRRTIRVMRNGGASLRIEVYVGEICMCVYRMCVFSYV